MMSKRENPVSQVTVDSQLTADQNAKLLKLLNKHRSVFAGPGNEGRSTTVTHRIPLVDETPIMRSRRVPIAWRAEVNREIKRLVEQNVIIQSCSPYAAPICSVRKTDGSLRLCIDYRALNGKTRNDAFPTSKFPKVIDNMAGARYFRTIDLARGYYQIPVHEEDKHKTAFALQTDYGNLLSCLSGLRGPLPPSADS